MGGALVLNWLTSSFILIEFALIGGGFSVAKLSTRNVGSLTLAITAGIAAASIVTACLMGRGQTSANLFAIALGAIVFDSGLFVGMNVRNPVATSIAIVFNVLIMTIVTWFAALFGACAFSGECL